MIKITYNGHCCTLKTNLIEYVKNILNVSETIIEDGIINLKVNNEMVGNRTKVKVVKNKVAPPFREAEFDIVYGKGISKEGNVLDIGVNLGIVEKAGAWFSYNGTRIGQGRENVKQYLVEHPDVCAEIEKKIRENYAQAFDKSLSDELVNATDDDE